MSSLLDKINEKKTELLKDKALQTEISKEMLNNPEFYQFVKETENLEKLQNFFFVLFEWYKSGNGIPLLEFVNFHFFFTNLVANYFQNLLQIFWKLVG
jgi:hypothetical protein